MEGISAVKALSLAGQAGQKIYTINKDNINNVLPLLTQHKQDTLIDISNAIHAGKEVTISEAPISYSGWLCCTN